MMKKIFSFLFSRPELDGIVLGLLISCVPMLFKDGAIPAADLFEAELPEFVNWQFYLFAGIPAGAFIAALAGKKFKLSAVTKGSAKNLFDLLKTAAAGLIGGGLFAAGSAMAKDLPWNKAASAARLQGSGGLFISGLLITAFLFALICSIRSKSSAQKKGNGK